MTIKLLAVGDIHLGRRPPRLPEVLAARIDDFSPAGAWERMIGLAIQEGVEAVLLAGDVAESTQDFFEALPRLQTGARRLERAGIALIAVSGNHDVDILPRLIDAVPEARLLGAGGTWESVRIPATDTRTSAPVTVWGWSFPTPQVRQSPIPGLPTDRGPGLHLGLLHCDRGQADSPYAPVSVDELRNAGLDAWLLGHIHQPDDLDERNSTGYLGSIAGLDAGEPGPRGPWLIEIDEGRIQRLKQRPIAPLRWGRLDVDLSHTASEAAVMDAFARRLDALARAVAREPDRPELMGLRIRMIGDCDLSRDAIEAALPESGRVMGLPGAEGVQWFIEQVRIDTLPVMPLERLAERDDQPGLLARRLLILQRGPEDPERAAMIDGARQHLQSGIGDSRWGQLPGPEPTPARIGEWLQRSGRDALRAMLAQEGD